MDELSDPSHLALSDMTWVTKLARALLRDDSAADDVAQDAWLIASQKAPRDGRPMRPWLGRVVLNLVRMRARSEKRRATREEVVAGTAQQVRTPAELVEHIETQRAVAGEVLALTEPYRSTVLLHYVEGLSSAEIARRMNIPDGTVRRRLKDALDEVRERLRKREDAPKGGWLAALAPLCGLPREVPPPAPWLLPAAIVALVAGALAILVLVATHDGSTTSPKRTTAPRISTTERDATPVTRVPAALVQPDVPPRRVAGTVAFDGTAVAGATVRLAAVVPSGPPLLVAERTTLADGTFDFGLQPAASFTVSAQAPQRTAASTRIDVADPRARPDQLRLALDACTARLFGNIRDASGGGVARARLSFNGRAGTIADDAGAYSLCVPPGARVRVEADGYGSLSIPTYTPGELHHDIVMVPESLVSGQVLDDASRPVPDALVTVTPEGPDGNNPFGLAGNLATTDASGHFAVDRLGPGAFRVAAIAGGLTTSVPLPVFTQPGRPAQLRVMVTARVRLHGRVVMSGTPVAGARIRFVDAQLRRSNLVESGPASFSQPDGTFTLDATRGRFDVLADPYAVESPSELVVERDTAPVIEVRRLASVRGRVTRNGVPVANAEIHCMRLPPSTITKTDSNGEFAFEGLPAGDNRLWAQSFSAKAYGFRDFTVADGEEAHVDLELTGGARVLGRVIDQANQPVPSVFVRLVAPIGDEGWAMTDAHGEFEATTMLGGTDYVANVLPTPEGGHPFISEVRTIHVRDGNDVVTGVEIPIQLERLSLRGRVIDDTGAPIADCHVLAGGGMPPPTSPDGIAFTNRWTRTAMDGSFEITNLARGPYTIAVACTDGGLGEQFNVLPGGAPIDVAVARAGTITGRLVGFTAPPVVQAIRITPGTIMGYVAIVDGDRFTLHGLAPDRYPVEALAGDQTDAQLVDLRPGSTASITLTARPTARISGRVVEYGTDKPVAGLQCETRVSLSGATGALQPMPRSAVTDGTGQFSVTAPVGSVRVLCIANGGPFSPGGGDVDVPNSGVTGMTVVTVRATPATSDPGFSLRPRMLPLTVFAVFPDGPATEAGLRAGDQLVAIDGAPVTGLLPAAAQRLIANHPAGTPLKLTVERAGSSQIVELVPRATGP